MDKINVIWRSYHEPDAISRGYWDQALLEELLAGEQYQHHTDFKWVGEADGAIVIINGRMHIADTEKINADIAKLRWCLFIETGDEEAQFPWREIHHPAMRVWIQLPRMNQHDDVSFHLPNGYRPTTRKHLKENGVWPRNIDVFFAGQVTHPRRENCRDAALQLTDHNVVFSETHSFGEEKIPYEQYLVQMVSAKIALCPSGPESPDSFRLYEALEAGCIPIVDAFASNNQDWGFWRYLFGDDIPFPVIDYWDKLPALVDELLKGYPENANKVSAWWQLKKREMRNKLEDDVRILSR